LQTLFLLLSPDILELIFMLHFLEFFHKDIFTIDGFLCWAIINADCLGCSFCGAVILLGGAEGVKDGGCSLETPHSTTSELEFDL
jgi:hypothetical protein